MRSRASRHGRRAAARALLGALLAVMSLLSVGTFAGALSTMSSADAAPLPAAAPVAPLARADTAGLRRVTLVNGRTDSLQVEVRASGVDSAGVASDGGDCAQAPLVGQATLAPGQRWSVVSAGAICYRTAPVGVSPTWSAWTRRVLASGERIRETL